MLALLLMLRFYESRINKNNNKTGSPNENPLFSSGKDTDDGADERPPFKVYDVRKDIDAIRKDRQTREKEFDEAVSRMKNNKAYAGQLKALKQRDDTAAAKLELLKRIENAKTAEERRNIIEEANKRFGAPKTPN